MVSKWRWIIQAETRFKLKVQAKLKTLDRCWHFKVQSLALLGIPDIIGVLNGRFFALELKKSAKEKPSKLQSHILRSINLAGGHARLVSPENWDVVVEELEFLGSRGLHP